jgi:hypothetical protein
MSVLHNTAAVFALEVGSTTEARSHLEQAVQAERAIGASSSNLATNLGWVLLEDGDADGAQAMIHDALRISRRQTNRSGIAYANVCFDWLATDRGDWHRGAVLDGVPQAFRYLTGHPWQRICDAQPPNQHRPVRACLSDEEFQRAYDKGRRLSVEEAFNVALRRGQLSGINPRHGTRSGSIRA